MEDLQKLTKKQLVTLQVIETTSDSSKGTSLKTIASRLEIKPPSALELVRALESIGLVVRKSGKTKLSAAGKKCLEEYNRHHRVAEVLFSHFLSPDEAHKAAVEIDLSISHELVEMLCAAEGHPKTCPHGKPIQTCSSDER